MRSNTEPREEAGRKRRRLPDLWFWSILALGLFLRVAWPTLAEFKLDEATVVRRAMAIAWKGDLPVAGMGSSIGMANLPLTLYLVAIPLRIWDDPVAAVILTGLVNGLAVAACYGLGKDYLNRNVGRIAAFLFAVNPWAVLLGPQNLAQDPPPGHRRVHRSASGDICPPAPVGAGRRVRCPGRADRPPAGRARVHPRAGSLPAGLLEGRPPSPASGRQRPFDPGPCPVRDL